VPIEIIEQFAASGRNAVELLRIERAAHGDAWNVATDRYEEAVVDFVQRIAQES
jgi:fermentation-respiration switch protein FrsA (DUF1100 family)